jgi:hypothetical protein
MAQNNTAGDARHTFPQGFGWAKSSTGQSKEKIS